jgi:predicted AAA+ superfamily ATPase
VLDNLFSGKIRVKLLTKLLLNPAGKVYLRGLERDLGVSSNTVRLELNKLSEMHLIEVQAADPDSKKKQYKVNTAHPLFQSLRGIILQYVGIDQILEQVIHKLGNVDQVYLTGDLAKGKNSTFVDLVLVGDIDKAYLYRLIEKVEPLIEKKIRVGLFAPNEFNKEHLKDLGVVIDLLEA